MTHALKETRRVARVLVASLNELERQPDIAAYLLARDCAGTLRAACGCPVWRFVAPRVAPLIPVVRTRSIGVATMSVETLFPERVRAFVRDFDAKKHPQLIKRP